MSKPYDASLKHLLADFAVDWVSWLAPQVGLPPSIAVEPLDVDLSTVQLSADKVFRLRPPAAGLLHIEAQAGWDGDLPERILKYNTLLHDRYGGPVYSIVLLLRREANATSLTGTVSRSYADGREYLRFRYRVVRVWELSAAELLSGGPGAMPLALLTDEAENNLEQTVLAMDGRLRGADVTEEMRQLVLMSGYLLLGMRYDEATIESAYARIPAVEESVTYQAILRRGRSEGLSQGVSQGLTQGMTQGLTQGMIFARQEDLIDILHERFGECPAELAALIRGMTDEVSLKAAMRQALRIASSDELEL